MILVDAHGRPMPKPEREDYPELIEWMRATWAWKDCVTSVANQAFDAAFRIEVLR